MDISGPFKRILLATIALVLFEALGFAALASDTDPRAEVQAIEARLPSVRKLAFKKPVPLDLQTAAQARDSMSAEIRKQVTPQQLQDDRDSGVMLALWPRNFDPERVALNMESSMLLGFYSPETKRMVMVAGDDAAISQVVDGSGKPISFPHMREMTLAHELTHALQDQYFDLSRLEHIRHDDDRQLAFRAIVEGDATLTGLLYTFKNLDSMEARTALGELISMGYARPREMVSVPDTITMPGGFVYNAGAKFVAYAFKHGGFAAVNELLRKLPSSTREILQPDKFFGHPTPPEKIAIRGYEKSLAGWQSVEENTLGEVMMVAMIHQNLGDAENWLPLGSAWRADRFVVLKNGGAMAVIGFIVFADPAMAAHFTDTYSRILDQVHGDHVPHLVASRNQTVLILLGEPAKRAPAFSEAVWSETQFGTGESSTMRPLHALPAS
jgi:hypothetical protein